MVSLGFVGFGEAAYHMTLGLKTQGLTNISAFDIVFKEMHRNPVHKIALERVEKSGVITRDGIAELVERSDTIVLAVPAQFTSSVGKDLISHLTKEHLLVDVTSASPSVKAELGRQCAETGVPYADSPMMGPLTVNRHEVPIITCGPGAVAWHDRMTPFGMKIQVIEGEPGRATQIKLARSIFTKGLEALLVETFMFARKCGVEEIVMESIDGTMNKTPFRQTATRYMASDLIHALRKSHELKEAVRIMRNIGMTPMVGEGAVSRLEANASMDAAKKLKGVKPASLDEIYQAWEDCGAI